MSPLSAEIITFAGRCGDQQFEAVEVKIDGLNTAFMMTLALPASSCRGLAGRVDTGELYRALAKAINESGVGVEIAQ